MKTNVTIALCIVIVLLTVGSASAWLDPYTHRQNITLTGGSDGAQVDYQIKLTIPYDTDMQSDFEDIRFTQADGETLIDAWLESKTDGVSADVWVEFPTTPANTVDQTYYMYYGNSGAASDWDGAATFLQYHGVASSTFLDAAVVAPASGVIYQSNMKCDGWVTSGLMYVDYQNQFVLQSYPPGNRRSVGAWNGGSNTEVSENPDYSDGSYHDLKMIYTGSVLTGYIDDNQIGTTVSSNFPTNNLGLNMGITGGTADQKWSFARKYVANPPTYAFGSEEFLHAEPPSIIAYNNITGTSDHVPLDYGTTVLFNATAGNSSTWTWTLDGADQGVATDSFTHTFIGGFGYYAVTVNATNALGTDTYTWGIWENIETTAVPVPTFTDTSYQMLLDSIDYPPNMEDFGKAMASPFVQMLGVIFYLFIFGVPLLMMYIRQDNMTLPTTLLLLFGSIIIFMLPPQWQIIAGALMTLGFVGILFKLYKERER